MCPVRSVTYVSGRSRSRKHRLTVVAAVIKREDTLKKKFHCGGEQEAKKEQSRKKAVTQIMLSLPAPAFATSSCERSPGVSSRFVTDFDAYIPSTSVSPYSSSQNRAFFFEG